MQHPKSLDLADPRYQQYVPYMSPISNDQDGANPYERSEAYKRCMHELSQPHPDYQAAQLYATLSLEDALRDMIAQLVKLTRTITVASRPR
jgi:hypothetical protein